MGSPGTVMANRTMLSLKHNFLSCFIVQLLCQGPPHIVVQFTANAAGQDMSRDIYSQGVLAL